MDAEPKPKTESSRDVDLNIMEHIEEMKTEEKDANQKLLEATICGLEETVREQNIVREQLEAIFRGQIKELKNKVREAHGTRATVEFKLRLKLRNYVKSLKKQRVTRKKRNPPSVPKGSTMRGSCKKEMPKVEVWKMLLMA